MFDAVNAEQLATIRSRVKNILRRDLKLGDNEIADDMPFLSSDSDLDSLDILLLVASVEREFGIKVSSEEVGRSAFQNVDTLTQFIHERSTMPKTSAAAAIDPLQRLPHAEPFRFVTRATSVNPGESAEGVWVVRGDEAFFAGHFPGRPIVPGMLIAEALAQLSGLVVVVTPADPSPSGKLAHVDLRFEQPVAPPAEIVLCSRLLRKMGLLQQFDVAAIVAGQSVARGTLALHVGPSEPPRNA